MARASRHAKDRVRQRLGLPKRKADDLASEALQYGVRAEETHGNLRKFVDRIRYRNPTRMTVCVWCLKVWIFDVTTLVTVYPLPGNLTAAATKLERRKRDGRSKTKGGNEGAKANNPEVDTDAGTETARELGVHRDEPDLGATGADWDDRVGLLEGQESNLRDAHKKGVRSRRNVPVGLDDE